AREAGPTLEGEKGAMRRILGCARVLVVVAAGPLSAPAQKKKPRLVIDKEKRTIVVPAKIAPRKIDDPRYKEIYPIEVIATFPFPRGKKAHETVVTFEARPSEVHKALESLGLKPGKPARTEADVQKGPAVKIYLQVGKARPVPVERFLVDRK